MKADGPQQRLLIQFSTSWGAEGAVDTGVALASILGLEVSGVFQLQEEALGLAGFPFARAQLTGALRTEQITETAMLQAMRRHSHHCHQLLRERAGRFALKWSYFDASQNQNTDEPKQAGFQILPRDTLLDPAALFRSVLRAASTAHVVVLSAEKPVGGPKSKVLVIADPAQQVAPVLKLAEQLALASNQRLVVLMLPGNVADIQSFTDGMPAIFDRPDWVTIAQLADGTLQQILSAIDRWNPSFVVADLVSGVFADEVTGPKLLRSINSAILLVAQNSVPPES